MLTECEFYTLSNHTKTFKEISLIHERLSSHNKMGNASRLDL